MYGWTGLPLALAVASRFIGVDAEMFAALPLDARALNHVPEVRDDAHLGEELAVLVEVNAPRIAAALGEHFKDMARGMIAPDARVHPLALACSGAPGLPTWLGQKTP